MAKLFILVFELLILALALWAGSHFWWQRYGGIKKSLAYVLVGCTALIAVSAAMAVPTPLRTVTLTAINEENLQTEDTGIYLEKVLIDGVELKTLEPKTGVWSKYKGQYCWFGPNDKRRVLNQTDSVTFQFNASGKIELVFGESHRPGKVLLQADNYQEKLDIGGGSNKKAVVLPPSTPKVLCKAIFLPTACFAFVLLTLCVVATLILELLDKLTVQLFSRATKRSLIQKLAGYQFLFEELVKRDFKKKYKRTVLGMAWSVLSPMLTLLVMRLVFTQFFGNHVAHYTTYLFCGNLVYSYFNEATSQGMTSLVSNAGIFTKVNIPKYLFLFSKNVQTLINFGLTLCVFFVFCVIDNITFTWKLLFLLYPIVCLVLFNIGVGLILSALFVFFKDIQYLWSVFTMLLMYISAIFYTIENYPPMVQNLFLLNPVYLFIRYFRKIVIEATIPTIWFHLLMLADVIIVVGLGCWIYKKNNTKFLYYV